VAKDAWEKIDKGRLFAGLSVQVKEGQDPNEEIAEPEPPPTGAGNANGNGGGGRMNGNGNGNGKAVDAGVKLSRLSEFLMDDDE
jgi:hypothetical protein